MPRVHRGSHHQQRHHAGKYDLGQVAREVSLERVDPLDRHGGDFGTSGTVRRQRLPAQTPAHERQPKLGQDAAGGMPAGYLHPPREGSA